MGNFSELSGVIQKDQIGDFTIKGQFLRGSSKQWYEYDEFNYKNPATDLPTIYNFTSQPSAFVVNPFGGVAGQIGFVNGGGINSQIIMRPGGGGQEIFTGLVNRFSENRYLIRFAGDVSSRLTPSEWQIGISYEGSAPGFAGGHLTDEPGVFFQCRDPGFGLTPIAGRIYAIVGKGAGGLTHTVVDTGVQQSGSAFMELCIVNKKTSIEFLINGAIVATITTNITIDGRGRPYIYMYDPAGGVPANGFTLDSWLYWQDR